eukprot:GEMP01003839.1.p1 GENE.GEMP01003839.1~~GEMP01003839.1.p1  ORF type:complete len:784 (+),score=158.65 GEMP01003839.1:152-2503(+)
MLLRAVLLVGAAGFPIGVPLQIVKPVNNHTSLAVVAESIPELIEITNPISLLSVVGPYHSGKSFLLNALMGNMKTFQVGPKTSPETMGIWICRTNFTASDGSEVWLVDSEGFFGPQVMDGYDAKVFTIATLLASHLVYNSVKIIDQQAVNLLEMLARRAQLFRTRSTVEAQNDISPNFLRDSNFPPLTWTVEDFVQEIPVEHGSGGATAWLKTYLTPLENSTQPYLTKLFKELTVKTLFLPAVEKKHLQDLSKLRFDELTPDFRREVDDLRTHLLKNTKAKPFHKHALTGRTFTKALQFVVDGLQTGLFPELPSMWLSWSQQVAERSLNDATAWFNRLTKAVPFGPLRAFNKAMLDAEQQTTRFYLALLEDFDASKNLEELNETIHETRSEVIKQYQVHAHQHFQKLIQNAEDEFRTQLEGVDIPQDPPAIKLALDKQLEDHVLKLSATWEDFKSAPKEGPVSLVWDGPIPVSQLRSHLEAYVSAKIAENDRTIQVLFQNAVQAALQSCDFDLQARRKLLFGTKQLKDLAETQMAASVTMFEENLKGFHWVPFHDQFKLHRALVNTEVTEKLRRFETENAASLNAYFAQIYEAAWEHYKAQKNLLHLPLDDEELSTAQSGLQLESLAQVPSSVKGSDVSDTKQYVETQARLNKQMVQEWHRLQKKNIDLWRIHSDEATQCALEYLRRDESQCSFFHLCVWHIIPFWHRSKCNGHLLLCLDKHQHTIRMSRNMQQKVFDSWYEKDLMYEASFARNNGIMVLCSTLVLLIFIFYGFRRGPTNKGF